MPIERASIQAKINVERKLQKFIQQQKEILAEKEFTYLTEVISEYERRNIGETPELRDMWDKKHLCALEQQYFDEILEAIKKIKVI